MSQCSLSVALCTYNGSAFLLEQLKSIAEQTLQPEELIISDDGSQDHTLEIATQFAKQAKFKVRLHANPSNVGSTKNFERAIQLSEGDIILLSDQDDVWLPQKIEKLYSAIGDGSLVYCDSELIDEQGIKLADGGAKAANCQKTAGFGRLLNQHAVNRGLDIEIAHVDYNARQSGLRRIEPCLVRRELRLGCVRILSQFFRGFKIALGAGQ